MISPFDAAVGVPSRVTVPGDVSLPHTHHVTPGVERPFIDAVVPDDQLSLVDILEEQRALICVAREVNTTVIDRFNALEALRKNLAEPALPLELSLAEAAA